MFTVAILAGGFAKRLHPITQSIPKSLVQVDGKAFIIHQLEYLRSQGVKRVVICVNHLGKMIQNLVGNGDDFFIKVSYSFDGAVPLGTGGAIVKALPLLEDNFFILYGDSFLPINYSNVEIFYKTIQQKALITVFKNDNKFDKSNVMFLDNQSIKYNKFHPVAEMNYIDYGLAVVSSSIFKNYTIDKNLDLANVYQHLSETNKLAGMKVHERFYEIGSLSGLEEIKKYFLKRKKNELF
jgi:NDP-sugar pyrophosphorylase family protein